jgi:hypothetical protein
MAIIANTLEGRERKYITTNTTITLDIINSIITLKARDTSNNSKFLKELQSKSLNPDNQRFETTHYHNSKLHKHTKARVVTGEARRKWKKQ